MKTFEKKSLDKKHFLMNHLTVIEASTIMRDLSKLKPSTITNFS